MGTICTASLFHALFFLPKLLAKALLYVNTLSNNNKMMSNLNKRHNKMYKGYTHFLQSIINMSDKESIYFAALTGEKFSMAQKSGKELYKANAAALQKVMGTSKAAVFMSKLCVCILSELVMQMVSNLTITSFMLVFLSAFILSTMVLSLILTINLSVVYCYNFDCTVGTTQRLDRMPMEMRRLLQEFGDLEEKYLGKKKEADKKQAQREQILAIGANGAI